MPRPRKCRFCRSFDGDQVYKPRSIPMSQLESVRLELSELEAMRLCDLDGFDQQEAGTRMGVSRGTIQRLLKEGRSKLLRAILESQALIIEKGKNDEALQPNRK